MLAKDWGSTTQSSSPEETGADNVLTSAHLTFEEVLLDGEENDFFEDVVEPEATTESLSSSVCSVNLIECLEGDAIFGVAEVAEVAEVEPEES